MKVRRVDHVGINVEDLDAAKTFFTDLGLVVVGEMAMEGALLDGVTGLRDARTEFFMVQVPGADFSLEVIKYLHPVDPEGIHPAGPHAHGLRHIAFQVDDLDGIVESLQQKGHDLVGSVQNYENIWKTCYVRGPEGIIVELAEKL